MDVRFTVARGGLGRLGHLATCKLPQAGKGICIFTTSYPSSSALSSSWINTYGFRVGLGLGLGLNAKLPKGYLQRRVHQEHVFKRFPCGFSDRIISQVNLLQRGVHAKSFRESTSTNVADFVC